jgi:hypothetical protein
MFKDVAKFSPKQYFCCTVTRSWFVFAAAAAAVGCRSLYGTGAQVVSGTAVAM